MSMNPFELHTEFNGKLTRIYIGKGITVWYSYETPVAFAISGYGTYKLENEGQTATTRKHLNSIAAKASLPTDEFRARLALLAHILDEGAQSLINRPTWSNTETVIKDGAWLAERNGWER